MSKPSHPYWLGAQVSMTIPKKIANQQPRNFFTLCFMQLSNGGGQALRELRVQPASETLPRSRLH
jgi:hypothetical protein